jgi:hypothetical protein
MRIHIYTEHLNNVIFYRKFLISEGGILRVNA